MCLNRSWNIVGGSDRGFNTIYNQRRQQENSSLAFALFPTDTERCNQAQKQ